MSGKLEEVETWICEGCGYRTTYAAGIQHAGRAPWCMSCDQPRVQVKFQQEWVPVDATS